MRYAAAVADADDDDDVVGDGDAPFGSPRKCGNARVRQMLRLHRRR